MAVPEDGQDGPIEIDVNTTKKICSKCREEKFLVEFHVNSSCKDGFNPLCKICRREIRKVASQRDYKTKRSREIDPSTTKKVCSKCGDEKFLVEFSVNSSTKDGFHSWCRICFRDIARILSRSDQKRKRNRDKLLLKRYGVSVEDYNRMLVVQDGKCAICRSESPGQKGVAFFIVDHDHTTGKVRGLLCAYCNKGIGRFKDSPDLLRQAACYLDSSAEELI